MRACFLILSLAVPLACQRQAQPIVNGPEALKVRVLAAYPHDRGAFTQGLVWFRGKLIESTGLHGRSGVRWVNLETGAVERSGDLPDDVFGEGLALVDRTLVQLSWKNERAYFWDLMSLKLLKEVPYEGEGWGLCYDGKRLVMSDGSDTLVFRDAKSFKPLGRVQVNKEGDGVANLNELECVGNDVYANVWQSEAIARIDATTGRVTGWIDASGLLKGEEKRGTDVLNGIAYDADGDRFFLTGKNWPKTFEVQFVAAQPAVDEAR